MEEPSIYNTGIYGTKLRILIDGVYLINSKIAAEKQLTIYDKKIDDGATLINGPFGKNSYQCFVIKYIEKSGFYSIMALHSHKFLGIDISEPTFLFSSIGQFPPGDSYFEEWEIECVDNSLYTMKLVGADLYLEYDDEIDMLHLNKPTNNDNQIFRIKTFRTINNGLYHICSKYDKQIVVTFSPTIIEGIATMANINLNRQSLFYIHFDEKDGCYLIVNTKTLYCLSSTKNSKETNLLHQDPCNNYDYNKWIITSYDLKSGYVYFELKSNLLRLGYKNVAHNIVNTLSLSSYTPYIQNSSTNLFYLIRIEVSNVDKQNFNSLVQYINHNFEISYEKNIIAIRDNGEINDESYYYKYFLNSITIPQNIEKISPNAFINCKMIKIIHCDPKWLEYFPNPLNVENIFVNDGITTIKDEFKPFKNLKLLSLPQSLRQVSKHAFESIDNLVSFVGNLNYINYVDKSLLKIVHIGNYIKCIPDETFADCSFLTNVFFEKKSKLKVIGSKAFANCFSLERFEIPNSVENIAPDAFYNCNKKSIPIITQENQRLSMIDNLIIDPQVTIITNDYSSCFNIESLEIPMTVDQIVKGVFDEFKRLKYIKCDPKWLNCFPNSKIECVFIPDQISFLHLKDFEKLTDLKFIEIPESVDLIEDRAFDACKNLSSFKCGTKHFPFLNQKKIKTLVLNSEVKSIVRDDFKNFKNLENLVLPEKILMKDNALFQDCKKLVNINNPYAEQFLNNKLFIKDGTTTITKKDYKNWTNLKLISIPKSVTSIEDDAFVNCQNINHLICDPKYFHLFIDNNCIKYIEIPNFVTELTKGQFDKLMFLSILVLPDNIKINDPCIFDSCTNLKIIKASDIVFDSLSEKTKERCKSHVNKTVEYVKPIYNYPPEVIHYIKACDENLKSNDENLSDENNNNVDETSNIKSLTKPKETTIEDLIVFDSNNEEYLPHIISIQMNIIECSIPKSYRPLNTDLSEIAKVCGLVCNEINKYFHIIPRTVQILVILRLVNSILNDENSKGSIGEVKTGEGKSLIITILSIILVKFNRKIDIVSSNLELVKRDQNEQEPLFKHFGIKTGVLYDKNSDYEFISQSIKSNLFDSNSENKSIYSMFNMEVLKHPVVYSTSSNFQYLHLRSVFSMAQRNREYDVVLVDEVDNMFIDESDSPLSIANHVDFAYSRDILEIVYYLQSLDTSEIIKFLEYYFPQIGIFEEENIEMLKKAANRATQLKKKVDYIIENDEVVIIDSNTGFKKLNTRWREYIHEMLEIKENVSYHSNSISICQITQNDYYNIYKKIVGVTGTIGSPSDEELLMKEYNIKTFKIPRHFESQLKVFIKERPELIKNVYKEVFNEIIRERNKGRPVLVIWDSIYHAEEFIRLKPFLICQKILGIKPDSDHNAIENAGIEGTVTIATSAAGRGVDIKLSRKAIEAGGLHVIIPMNLKNQRSLEQAAGRAGRQDQPGSVTFYTSNDDKYIKQREFSKGNTNLLKIQHLFAEYLRKNFSWMLLGPRTFYFVDIKFPFASTPTMVLNIMARRIALFIKICLTEKKIEYIQDLSLRMVMLAWGVFFTGLYDNVESCEDWEMCVDLYNDFIQELSYWFNPKESTTPDKAIRYIRKVLIREIDWESIIIYGVKITAIGLCFVFPLKAPVIIISTGVVLSGGQEIYHQLQNGNKINWLQVLIRCGGSVVRNSILLKFGIKNKAVKMLIYVVESELYNRAAFDNFENNDDEFYDDELEYEPSASIKLSKNINGTSQKTNKWIYENIKYKKKKPKGLIKFKPKIYSVVLNIDFIRLSMKLASDAYDGKFRFGKVIFSSLENDFSKPVFYCLEDSKNLFVAIRGSQSPVDWLTDFIFFEVHQNINGKEIYFHKGFYDAAIYIINKIDHLLKQEYETIYFIGHSYAAAVSSVLTMLIKSNDEYKDRNIYAIAFAPPPAMSYCPSNINNCIYSFINRNDIVTTCSFFNVLNTAAKNRMVTKIFVNKCLDTLRKFKIDWLKYFIYAIEQNFEKITESKGVFNVRKVKGILFRIGVGNKKRVSDCKIKESQLPTNIIVEMTSLNDHRMDEYIRSFKNIQF